MAKESFGEYAGYTTPGGIRFQHNGKLVPRAAIPVEVAAFLDVKLAGPDRGQVVERTRPTITPEESARLKAETTAVKPELQMTPEQIEERTLTPEDFAEEAPVITETTPVSVGLTGIHTVADIDPPFVPTPTVDPDFLESVSIHTASIYDIAEALYNRFGLYTVYLRRLPVADETNPLTGELFTNYHLGIAYQAAIRAINQGILERDPRLNRDQLDAGRAASANMEASFVPQPKTFGEARAHNSFDYRTSVRGMNEVTDPNFNGASQKFDGDEDEMIVEPRFGQQIIRPNW